MTKSVEKNKDQKDAKHAVQATDAKTSKIQHSKDSTQEKGAPKFETPQKPNK